MNKDTLSWIHYFYATVTASVLAYVTSMDMGDKNDNDESSAIDMLPDFGSNEETEVYEEPQEQEVFEEAEAEVYEEPQEEEVFEEPQEEVYQEPSRISELPVAEPVNTVTSSNGGKLKKNKTKNKKNKNNKTRNRK
jgi:hypothetical protein